MVPAQCYERVVRLDVPGGTFGSAFTIDRHERQWLITAEHVVARVSISDITLTTKQGRVAVGLERVPPQQPGADVAVFLLDRPVTPNLTLHAGSDGVVYSQDAYFLGFPYGMGLQTPDLTYPFVKRAIVSANTREFDGVIVWYLDGINNPGFSGGPVVLRRDGTDLWQVCAIVSAYRTEQVAVLGAEGAVPMNTGIIIGYDIAHAVDAIDQFLR